MTAAPHQLQASITIEDGTTSVRWSATCPHVHPVDRDAVAPYAVPDCTTWEEAPLSYCICDCDACRRNDHGDCNSNVVPDVGPQWCRSRPAGECWWAHAINEADAEALDATEALVATWPVDFVGGSWDEPITFIQKGAPT